MIHIILQEDTRVRHEYWERYKYELPIGSRDRHPYYVCYVYGGEQK